MGQQQGQFDQNLALRRQQEDRLGALLPMQQREAQLKLDALNRQNDPQAAMAFQNKWQQAINGMQQPGGGAPFQGGPTINVGGTEMPLSAAQAMASFNAPIPGLQDSLKNYYAEQKKYGEESAKARVKNQEDRGEALSSNQSALQSIGRIKQGMENYRKETKAMGMTPHYGVGAEQRTEPDAWERFKGRAKQRIAHPLESLTSSVTEPEIFGEGRAANIHEKHLSGLRTELNELVNVKAKDLNTRFTDNEYRVLQRNKPSIGDSEAQLTAKLNAVEGALKSSALKLKMHQSAAQKWAAPGTEPFTSEQQYPSQNVGRAVTGEYSPPGSKQFKSGNYEYVVRDGKTYRKKVGG